MHHNSSKKSFFLRPSVHLHIMPSDLRAHAVSRSMNVTRSILIILVSSIIRLSCPMSLEGVDTSCVQVYVRVVMGRISSQPEAVNGLQHVHHLERIFRIGYHHGR